MTTKSTLFRSQAGSSFPNHELLILLTVLVLTLMVGIPAWQAHGWKGCLLALLAIAGVIATLGTVVVLWFWIAENMDREGRSFADKAWQGVGHALRFASGAFLGLLIAAPLVVPRHLGPLWENLGLFAGAVLLGGISVWLYLRVGVERYRRMGRLFLGALLVSWLLGLLSLLVPWPHALDLAVLAPLIFYAVIVIRVRPKAL